MNIQTNYYNYNICMQGKGGKPKPNKPPKSAGKNFREKLFQKLLDALPEKTLKDGSAKADKFNNVLSRPDVNRFIMGATALLTQPTIDYYNHRVDEETRVVSRNRTIAKILAGTSVGIIVRGICYQAINKMTNLNGTKKYSKWLIPEQWAKKFADNPTKLGNYKNALSTSIALCIMLFTNFLIDAPLTVYLTNKFNAKSAKSGKLPELK